MDKNILNRFNSYEDYINAIKIIYEAMKNGKLVFFIGAGVSRIQGYENWNGYVQLMLQYWSDQIIKDSYSEDSMKYVKAIQQIKESRMSNKRKIDLLYELLEDFMPEEFEARKTEFEEKYFIKLSPINVDNKVLYAIASLDAAYITTNYDIQIEKHLEKMKKNGISVTDMTDLNEKIHNDIFINTVIHLHGVPYGHKEDFISSGESYKKHYYENNNKLEEIRKWLSDKHVTLVFIGSSMEEDEILSLIPEQSNNIAILKTDDGSGPVGDYLRKVKSDFFYHKNKTKVLWYGDNHSDLFDFVDKLKDEIIEQGSSLDKSELVNPTISPDTLISFINNSEISDIDNALTYIPEENKDKIFRNFEKLKFVDHKNKNISFMLLNIFTDRIDKMRNEYIDKIVRYMTGNNNSYNFKYSNVFVEKCSLEYSELEELYKKLSTRIDIEYTSFKNNKNVMGWKIINDIKTNNRRYYGDINLYNFSLKAERTLYELMSSDDFNKKYKFLTGEQIINDNTGLNTLYKSIKNNSLQVNNVPWNNELQDKFFNNTIFIKLLMLVYKYDGLPQLVINKVIKYFDFSGEFLGNDFKQFIIDNTKQIKSSEIDVNDIDYRNAIGPSRSVNTISESIIDEEDLKKLTTKELLENIIDSKYQKTDYLFENINNPHVKNIEGTIHFFKQKLSGNNKEQIEKILNLMTYNDGSLNMFTKYKVLYEWFLKEYTHSYDKENMFKFICSNYKNLKSFDPWDSCIFEEMIRNGESFVVDNYLEIDITDLEEPIPDFNLSEFMNSSMGSYLLLFYNVLKKNNSYAQEIKCKIESLRNEQIKEFMMGRHYDLFGNSQFNESYHLIGFSSKYLMGIDYTEMFKNSAKEILRIEMNNNLEKIIMKNVFLVLLQELNPFNLEVSNNSQIFGILDVILQYKNNFVYEREWMQYIYDICPNDFLNEILLQSTINPNTDKIILAIEEINNCLSKGDKPIINPKFYSKLLNLPDDISVKISNILYECADEKNLKNYSIQIVEYILHNISYENQKELINKLVPYLSYVQINNLKSKYIHL